MKRFLQRIAAVTLSAGLLLQTGAALGDVLWQDTVALSAQSTLTQTTYADSARRTIREAVLTYTPGEDLKPGVVYGTTLYGKSTMDTMEQYPDAWGFSVVAGVNGAFFDVDTGIPYGCVITNGAVRSSGDLEAVGFRADGSAVIGKPGLSVTVELPTGEAPMAVHVNKTLSKTGGMVLYTRDYDSTTKNEIPAFHVVLEPQRPDLLLGGSTLCTVRDIFPNTQRCQIPAGCFVLSMAEETSYPATLQNLLLPLAAGDPVSISVSIRPEWQDVVSACGGMEMLVENGLVRTDFTLSGAKGRTARTAVGLRSDGTLVFCTVDNRAGETGLTLAQMAQRMLDLGCETALNLDGGGSTAIRALYPGMEQTQTVNKPSDGSLRKCANFIFLTRPQQPAGEAAQLHIYPRNPVALPGGQIPLTVTATDASFRRAELPEELLLQADVGLVTDGVFLAEKPGLSIITAQAGTLQQTGTVQVIESPDIISLRREDGDNMWTLKRGESMALTAEAIFAADPVFCTDESFVWTCSSEIGSIDETGLFTAGTVYVPTTGDISCTAGNTVRTITVTVQPDNPFPDTETHWAKEPVADLYKAGVLTGSFTDGIPLFRPDDAMTRQEFLAVLSRWLQLPPDEQPLPFADAGDIAPWALDAVSGAYGAGYLTGSLESGVLFCRPGDPVSRQEAMVILSRILPTEDVPADTLSAFSDAEQTAFWARDGLAAMIHAGVISGMGDGTLAPVAPVTRAQVARMLWGMTRPTPTEEVPEEVPTEAPEEAPAETEEKIP